MSINPTYQSTFTPPTPATDPQPAPSRFSFEAVQNTLAWAAGACSSYFGLDFLLTHDYYTYRNELLEKIPDENLKLTLSHLATAIAKQLRQTTKSSFIQGFVDSSDERVTEIMQTVLLHALVTLKGTSPTANIIQASAENLLKTVHEFSKKEHRTLQASCQAYKTNRAPDTKKAALEVLSQEFTPLVDELIQKMGLDEKSLSKIVHTKAGALEAALKPWLTEQCVDWYLEFSKSEYFSEQETEKLNAMGGKEIVHLFSQTAAQKSFIKISQTCSDSSDQIALTCSEKLLPHSLSLEDQCTIAKNISGLFAKENQTLPILSDLLHTPVTTVLTNGLCRLALKSPDSSGNTLERLEGYVKNIIKDLKIDPELSKRIQLYRSKVQKIETVSQELETLKIEELNGAIGLKETRQAKIKQLETLIEQLTNSIDVNEKERLLHAFRPLVKKVLSDMGYEKGSDLPLPALVQNNAFSHLSDIALPELLIDYYGQFTDAIDSLTRESKSRNEHAENLRQRFGSDKLINTARPFAKVLVQSIKSTLLVESKNLARKGIRKAQKLAQDEEKLQTVLTKNQRFLVSWTAEHGTQGLKHIETKYGQIIEDETEAFLIRILDNLTSNIEKIEQNDPKRTFVFVLDCIGCLTEHLRVINKVTREEKKSHMYEVDPMAFVKAFEAHRILDPAMPSSELQTQIASLKQKKKSLREQIQQNTGDILAAKHEFEKVKNELSQCRHEAATCSQHNFHQNFINYFLTFCSINGPQDLPGPEKLQTHIWQLLHSQAGAALVSELFIKAFEPEKLDKYLRISLETVNENLLSPDETSEYCACSEEDTIMAKHAIEFLKEVRKALPGTIFGTLHRIDEIQKLPANIVAKAMRKTFKDYCLNSLLEYSLVKGSVAATELLEEPFPKTAEEAQQLKNDKANLNNRDIKKYHKEAGETVYNGAEAIKQHVVGKWASFQSSLNERVSFLFGRMGIVTKKFLDPIMHVIFIDCVARPLFSIFNLCMKVLYFFYSKQIVYHAEHFRRCVSRTPIHSNFGLAAMRLFQLNFPAVGKDHLPPVTVPARP